VGESKKEQAEKKWVRGLRKPGHWVMWPLSGSAESARGLEIAYVFPLIAAFEIAVKQKKNAAQGKLVPGWVCWELMENLGPIC